MLMVGPKIIQDDTEENANCISVKLCLLGENVTYLFVNVISILLKIDVCVLAYWGSNKGMHY